MAEYIHIFAIKFSLINVYPVSTVGPKLNIAVLRNSVSQTSVAKSVVILYFGLDPNVDNYNHLLANDLYKHKCQKIEWIDSIFFGISKFSSSSNEMVDREVKNR